MAEAVVGPIIEVMLGKLLTLAEDQISLVRHFKDDLEKLGESLTMVQAFLHDAEKKKVTNSAVKVWLRQLEDLAFDADNVIDDIDYEFLSKKVKRSLNKKVQSLFSSSPFSHRQKMGSRIKVINERLEKINQRATAFGLEIRLVREQDILDAYGDREENAFSVDPIFVGRENEVSEIVKMLTTASPAGHKSYVLPIVGMGGQGKTTIAREVFHDERIISHFGNENRVWVHVSQNFDVRNILKNILTSITTKKSELETQQDILKKLQGHLGAKKYLLVLDDVWNEDRVKWDDFENSLSGISSANGYSMIVTTRSQEVASIVKTLDVHNLKGLPEDDCWSIIKAKAFTGGDIPADVEEIGKNIAKKCQGLPLAAKLVGGLMSSMKSNDEWSSIEKNWLSNLEDENPISNVLKLSFDHLSSPSLKKCFAYCSIFPKGYNIQKERLVELWMAEGFLQTNHQIGNNNIDMETTGRNNFSILLRKSLLQCVRSDDYGNVTHCNMHDLVHDLACSVLCEGSCKSRYIGYKPSGDGLLSIPKGQERYVRTLFFGGKVSDIKFSDFESLHTLTLVRRDTDHLPTSIRELKHLRYLDISQTSIRCLSNSIGELYHLQTLRTLMWCEMEILPDFSCLISLRHLHISRQTTISLKIGKLTSLQTMPYYHVGGEKGCEISQLGKLKHLKGNLEIRNLGKVSDKNEAMSADLLQKPGIYKLKLVWGKSKHEANEESVLEGLQPHPNLKSFEICGFKGKGLPLRTSKMIAQLNNRVEIKLEGCSECEELPMLGQLQNLKYLYLCNLTNVKSIGPSFYGIDSSGNGISYNGVCTINVALFPALKKLELVGMTNLKVWDDLPLQPSEVVVVVFQCLQYLKIKGCVQLTRAPSHFPCLQKLKIYGMNSGLPLENICGMKLTTLTQLNIGEIKELECLPDELFSNNRNLSKLNIWGCPNMTRSGGSPSLTDLEISKSWSLRELPGGLHSLNSLERLVIHKCPDLKSIQQQGFSSLKKVSITNCKGLRNLPIEMLESCALSLEGLSLNGLTNISEVIGCLHKMTRLTSLNIRGVPKFSINSGVQMVSNLKCLDMGPSTSDSYSDWDNVSFNETVDAMLLHFTSLRELSLQGMEYWDSLPDGIQHLTSLEKLTLCDFGIKEFPEWFGNLSYLKTLDLCRCKKLRQLPSKQFVESELAKISHIPTVDAGGRVLYHYGHLKEE